MGNHTLGNRIRSLREESLMSQLELAKILNIGNTTLSQYESDKRVPSDTVKKKIAEYFNVSIDYLLGNSDIRNPYIGNQNNKVEETQNIKKEPEKPKESLPENKKEPSDSDLATTQMVIDRLIEEGLLKDDKIDARIANMLLNSLKVDIELKLNKKKKDKSS